MPWLIALGILIIAGLGWYAWSLTQQVKVQERKRAQSRQDALLGIQILIDSYLDDQVEVGVVGPRGGSKKYILEYYPERYSDVRFYRPMSILQELAL